MTDRPDKLRERVDRREEDLSQMERLAAQAAQALAGAPADEVIAWAARTFGRRICITSSMTDAVLVNLVSRHAPGIDVLFRAPGGRSPEVLEVALHGRRRKIEAYWDGCLIMM